ncbi:MAG: zinc transporter, family [Solirubrobacteraceae bacterium]|jgi:ZIP family zinc transporter|nr:zinc transporter, family [Solirubrobacteraceae bacterium]
MLGAIGWGALAAGSLVIGALLAFAREWSDRQVGLVLAFGAGALISAVSFELADEGIHSGGLGWTAAGLAAGAATYFALDGLIGRRSKDEHGPGGRSQGAAAGGGGGGGGTALALGAFLDGVPEQLVLGIGLATDGGVGASLLVAIFVSNLPEAIGSARDMREAGSERGRILVLWCAVAAVCAAATVLGYLAADAATGEVRALVDGFAAGALLVMLIDSMIPEARHGAGRVAGLATTLGFAVAAGLSSLS